MNKAYSDTTSDNSFSDKAIQSGDFNAYQTGILHDWLKTLTVLTAILVPLFFVLDIFMMPRELLPRFAIYRGSSTLIALIQLLLVWHTKPSRRSFLWGYLVSIQVGGIIAFMTTDLGGFGSNYYAGLNLVIIGVNLLMPWHARHTAYNAGIIIGLYLAFNLLIPVPFQSADLINHLFFLVSTAVVAVSINYVRFKLIEKEFSLLVDLKKARDSLWSEMELAKRIQTALLPRGQSLRDFEMAVTMLPADEVGGDYYDIIQTDNGDQWVAIGDVAGHGVDSGLIMMMAQTIIMTLIKSTRDLEPVELLNTANRMLREDITRLGSNHYMTLMVVQLKGNQISITGHHQDMLIYRPRQKKAEAIATKGTWLGIAEDINTFLEVRTVEIEDNDMLLLFTDGITEGMNAKGEMYGQERLLVSLERYAEEPVETALAKIMHEVRDFPVQQDDDMTLILLKKKPRSHHETPG